VHGAAIAAPLIMNDIANKTVGATTEPVTVLQFLFMLAPPIDSVIVFDCRSRASRPSRQSKQVMSPLVGREHQGVSMGQHVFADILTHLRA
jgi:hypothetical protein